MTSSLFTALSGLQAHQGWIDVIGNNLSNANTPGYKTSRATFADAFSQTLSFASSPSNSLGGRNPVQVGLGVTLASIGRNVEQGALNTTGRGFDLALEGRGFFTLSNGAQNLYTRVGTFGLDADRNLVDQRTGLFVLGTDRAAINVDVDELFPPQATSAMTFAGNLPAIVTGPLAEVLASSTALSQGSAAFVAGTGTAAAYAVPPGSTHTLEVVVGGGAPQLVSVLDGGGGSLLATDIANAIDQVSGISAVVGGSGAIELTSDTGGANVSIKVNPGSPNDLAALVGMPTAQVNGSEIPIGPTSMLNDLPANLSDYVPGDQIQITGVDSDGSPISAFFTYGTGAGEDGVLVNDFVNFVDGLYAEATVSLNTDGQLQVEASNAGEADLLLAISDLNSPVNTQWQNYAVSVTTDGTPPDTVVTSSEVFDQAGAAHTMTMTYERQVDGTWNLVVSIPPEDGQVLVGGAGNEITGITFAEDGSPVGLGSVLNTASVLFAGQTTPQAIVMSLGSDGDFDGLTQFGGQSNAFVQSQDGYADGSLANISVDIDGSINGFYTNGQARVLGAVGISTFANEEGLQQAGNNLFTETPNSGEANLGAGARGGAGNVVGGALENSNVDTAAQFVRLIEAQRGFQANARIISIQDEVLAEVVNLV